MSLGQASQSIQISLRQFAEGPRFLNSLGNHDYHG
jgi:hypothetical protein